MRRVLTIVVLSFVLPAFGVAAGLGCAGVKPNQSTGKGGSNSSGNGGSNGSGGSFGTGGGGGNLPVTTISGDHTCSDFSRNCTSYRAILPASTG